MVKEEKALKRDGYRREYAKEMLAFFSLPEEGEALPLPSFVKFAARIGVSHACLLSWCETHAEFAAAYEECRARLHDRLIDGVLAKKYDASFVKLLLQESTRATSDETHEGYEIVLRVEE